MRLTYTCPKCLKNTELLESKPYPALKKTLNKYKCGHSHFESMLQIDFDNPGEISESEKQSLSPNTEIAVANPDFTSVTGTKHAYDYQKSGMEFIAATNYNCMIADAMGLGKTIQGLLAARKARKQLFPVLVIVKSATTFQWCREIQEWYENDPMTVCPIIGSQTPIIPGFAIYVISMDTLGRNGTYKKLLALGIKLVIVDECHSFKDPDSKRTKALLSFIKDGGIKHKILLSGTPIKNRANEYFVSLNMLRPDLFPSLARFQRSWLQANEKGIYTRLLEWRIAEFKSMTSNFILRREKTEVLKNLPAFNRNFQYMEIEDPIIKASYNKELSLFANFGKTAEALNSMQLLGWLAKMRRLTGMAKVPRALEYVEEFLENFDTDKLAIGIHHEGVRDTIYHALRAKGYRVMKLSGEDSAARKDQIVQDFALSDNRILIINVLAGGVGLNLQMCSNTIVLERQWNSADEEQFESRFHRNGQERPVFADYLIAHGTLDQWFHDMVQEKRRILIETGIGVEEANAMDFSGDQKFLVELVNKTLDNPLQ